MRTDGSERRGRTLGLLIDRDYASFLLISEYRIGMAEREFDNVRDRYQYGYDAGQIIDGTVTLDEARNRFILVDEDGVGFDVQAALQSLMGKRIRLTMASFESMENLEKMLAQAQGETPNPTSSTPE